MDLSFLLSNPLINASVASWAAAQAIKTLVDAVKHKQFDRHRLAGAGGMPSSHSAVTCSVLLTSYYLYGFNSPVFALSFVLALIVMYDATGVRWAAGLHARAINHIVEYLETAGDAQDRQALRELIPRLNESLGHRVREAICGAALGFLIAVIGHSIRLGYFSLF
ncbi:divergent PAP2 family protein [Acutalibacter caecimuris]|uniref:divergent PAP2 family protein n=1 Tax=Acutalibacter caecimuris TaxID=3093657 RepID=UPI002AC8F7A0|nr:divergent PAP2 family protein [Acutalibacter sp. M00118]